MTQGKTTASLPDIDDVQWSAMQYVLGELSDEQTELFETAMANDVALCEAVLAATQLTCGIAVACKMQPLRTETEIGGARFHRAEHVKNVLHVRKTTVISAPVLTQPVTLSVAMIAAPVPFSRPPFARFGVFAAAVAMALAVLAMVTLQTRQGSGDSAAVDDATTDALALLLDDPAGNDMNTELEEWTVSDDSVSGLVAPEWLLTAVDLDAAAASKDQHVIGPDDEAGVY